jgi:hypothetical protein
MYRYNSMIVCSKLQFIASLRKPTIPKFDIQGRFGVWRGPVDKAPSCCKVAQDSIIGPAPREMGSSNANDQTHRTPHQNLWMLSPKQALRRPQKKILNRIWEMGGEVGSAPACYGQFSKTHNGRHTLVRSKNIQKITTANVKSVTKIMLTSQNRRHTL